MQLWEFVLAADRKLDLADPAAATAWFSAVPNRQIGIRIRWDSDTSQLEGPILEKWRKAVHTLRSLAGRLKGRKTREPGLEPLTADHVFGWYVGQVRLRIARADDDMPSKPLTARSFLGVRLGFEVIYWRESDYPTIPDLYWRQVAGLMDAFWRQVFGSLATDELKPVCDTCGAELGGPSGRKPRTGRCKKCVFKAWYKKQPRAKLRERWRAASKATREREHDQET